MRSGLARKLLGSGVLVLLVTAAGCGGGPLFPKDLPSTPYERYNDLRGRQSAAKERGALRGEPNLRQRLRPLE